MMIPLSGPGYSPWRGVGWRLWLVLIWAGLGCSAWAEGKVWALVIGVDEYVRTSIPKLRYAVADAKLFSQALHESVKVPGEQIFLLTSDSVDSDNEPKATNVGYRLSWLKENVKAEDTLIFYFAGHGLTLEGEPFLLTEEADNRTALTLKFSALHQGEVVEALRQTRAANCWLVLDACRNNPADRQENRLSPEASRTVTSADVGVAQTATMFSCKLGERAWEWDEKKHGFFTYFLVEGLRAGGADSNGRVTLQGLSQYLGTQVPLATQKMGASQNPWMLYGGPGQDRWLLATLDPSQAATSDSAHVARLEGLQARLDQETARRVAAEQKARLEESKRMELEQRLALLEGRLSGKTVVVSSGSAANPQAYREGGADELEVRLEVLRLTHENAILRQKLKGIEEQLAARRLGAPPGSQAWKAATTREKTSLARLARGGLSAAERLSLQQALQQAYADKIEVLEKSCSGPLGLVNLPQQVNTEAGRLFLKIQMERQRQQVCQARLAAATVADAEASQRVLEAESRLQMVAWDSLIDRPKWAEFAVVEDRLTRMRQDRKKIEAELARLQQKALTLRSRLEVQEERLGSMRLMLDQVPACEPVPVPPITPP